MKLITSIILVLLAASVNLFAQINISGTIKDTSNTAISFASIELKNNKEPLIKKSIISNKDGYFIFDKILEGEYTLVISCIGYHEHIVQISIDSKPIEIAIQLKAIRSVGLSNITITSKKQQVEQKIDRLVFNVAGTPIGVSGSALEILERLPGIEVNMEGGTINLNGKQNVGILINNKLARISISNLIQMLSGTNGNNIDKIEIISNPPAKYEAEFTGGLINIIYKKKDSEGFSGSYLLGVGYGDGDKEKMGLNWSFKRNKLLFFGDINYDRNYNPRIFTFNSRSGVDTISINNTISDRRPVITTYTGRMGLDYYVTRKWTMGFLGNFSSNLFKEKVNSLNNYSIMPPSSLTTIKLWNKQNSFRNLATLNFNNSYKFDSLQSISMDIDYLNFYSKAPNDYRNTYYDEHGTVDSIDIFRAFKITPVRVWAGKVDYSKNLKKNIRLDIGGKYTNSKLKNDVEVENLINNSYQTNETLSDHSKMNEKIIAAYSSLNWDIDKLTKLNMGLRFENYNRILILKNNLFDNKNANQIFPNFFISRAIDKSQNIQFSYGRRINRPSFFDLAPYILFLDPHTFSYGNINLKPAIANIFSLSYKYKSYISTMEYTIEKNTIVPSQAIFADNGDKILTSLNISALKTTSLSFIIPINFTKWWSSQNTIQGVYLSQLMSDLKGNDTWLSFKTTQNFKINKTLGFQIFTSYSTKRLLGFSVLNSMQRVSLSLDKKFEKLKSSLQFSFNNIFGTDYSFTTNNNMNYSYVKYAYEPRIVRITFTKNFGVKKDFERKRETAGDEQKKRLE